jgi:hypothetical protein
MARPRKDLDLENSEKMEQPSDTLALISCSRVSEYHFLVKHIFCVVFQSIRTVSIWETAR